MSVLNPLGLRDVVVTLKAAPGFAATLLDGLLLDGRTLSWLTRRELSHASIYYRPQAPRPLPPVPLAAGLVLLPSALAGMLLWQLRRKAGRLADDMPCRAVAATA